MPTFLVQSGKATLALKPGADIRVAEPGPAQRWGVPGAARMRRIPRENTRRGPVSARIRVVSSARWLLQDSCPSQALGPASESEHERQCDSIVVRGWGVAASQRFGQPGSAATFWRTVGRRRVSSVDPGVRAHEGTGACSRVSARARVLAAPPLPCKCSAGRRSASQPGPSSSPTHRLAADQANAPWRTTAAGPGGAAGRLRVRQTRSHL